MGGGTNTLYVDTIVGRGTNQREHGKKKGKPPVGVPYPGRSKRFKTTQRDLMNCVWERSREVLLEGEMGLRECHRENSKGGAAGQVGKGRKKKPALSFLASRRDKKLPT